MKVDKLPLFKVAAWAREEGLSIPAGYGLELAGRLVIRNLASSRGPLLLEGVKITDGSVSKDPRGNLHITGEARFWLDGLSFQDLPLVRYDHEWGYDVFPAGGAGDLSEQERNLVWGMIRVWQSRCPPSSARTLSGVVEGTTWNPLELEPYQASPPAENLERSTRTVALGGFSGLALATPPKLTRQIDERGNPWYRLELARGDWREAELELEGEEEWLEHTIKVWKARSVEGDGILWWAAEARHADGWVVDNWNRLLPTSHRARTWATIQVAERIRNKPVKPVEYRGHIISATRNNADTGWVPLLDTDWGYLADKTRAGHRTVDEALVEARTLLDKMLSEDEPEPVSVPYRGYLLTPCKTWGGLVGWYCKVTNHRGERCIPKGERKWYLNLYKSPEEALSRARAEIDQEVRALGVAKKCEGQGQMRWHSTEKYRGHSIEVLGEFRGKEHPYRYHCQIQASDGSRPWITRTAPSPGTALNMAKTSVDNQIAGTRVGLGSLTEDALKEDLDEAKRQFRAKLSE